MNVLYRNFHLLGIIGKIERTRLSCQAQGTVEVGFFRGGLSVFFVCVGSGQTPQRIQQSGRRCLCVTFECIQDLPRRTKVFLSLPVVVNAWLLDYFACYHFCWLCGGLRSSKVLGH